MELKRDTFIISYISDGKVLKDRVHGNLYSVLTDFADRNEGKDTNIISVKCAGV